MAPSLLRAVSTRLACVLLMVAVASAMASATDDGYTLEQLDRAHDIITGMHPDTRGALYRRAADAELTAEELFLQEEAVAAVNDFRGGGPTLGGISAMPNIPDDPPARGKGRR